MKSDKENSTLWFSIGENCLTLNILRRFNLNSPSTIYSSTRSNIQHLIKLEKSDYNGFLEPDNLYEGVTWSSMDVFFSSLYSSDTDMFKHGPSSDFEFTHVDPLSLDMKKRVTKQLELRNNNCRKVFVYHHRSKTGFEEVIRQNLLEGAIFLLEKYKNSSCIFFTQKIVDKHEERGYDIEVENGIIFCTFKTLNPWKTRNEEGIPVVYTGFKKILIKPFKTLKSMFLFNVGKNYFWAYCDNDLLKEAWNKFCEILKTSDQIK